MPDRIMRPTDQGSVLNYTTAGWFQRQALFAIVLIALVWAFVISQITSENSTLRRSDTDNLSNIAVTLSHNISRTSGELDTLLQFMRAMRRSKDASVSWQDIITEDYTLNRHTVQIAVIDKDGMMITSSKMLHPPKPVDLSDREHYRVHRDGIGDNLFISKPVLGRASGKWSVQYTRPLLDGNGGFDGVIVVSLDPAKLTRIYGNLDLGEKGGVIIVGNDGIIRAGTGEYATHLGQKYSGSTTHHETGGTGASAISAVEERDGTSLLASKVAIDGYPLQVVVLGGAAWIYKVYALIAGAVVLSVLTISALFASVRYRIREGELLHEKHRFVVEKEVAEAASKAKGEFLAVMSHEIRTPLNGVLGALDLIKSEPLTASALRHLDIATTSGEHLLALIDDILVFSKLEGGQFKFEEHPQSMQSIFESLQDLFDPLTEKAGNRFILKTSEALPRSVLVDAVRLRQVLINLLTNANKFTNGGTITLTGTLVATSDESATMHFAVSDTGIGIPADKQAIIFEKFQSLDSTFSRRTDGTGLGLTICDKIVRAMGGEIEVASEYGKGSCFSFQLTFKTTDELPANHSKTASSSMGSVGPLRILLAEDNPTNAYIGTQYLTAEGHQVVHAANGNKAVEQAASMQFNVILMDISMPDKDGLTAAREIRDGEGPNRSTPIIALTAHAISGTAEQVESAGMNAYLTKPIRRERLIETVNIMATPDALAGEVSPASTVPIIEFGELSGFFEDRNIDENSPLMTIFVNELEAKRTILQQIADSKEPEEAASLAHAIYGSASTVGAARLAKLCKKIEIEAKSSPEDFDWSLINKAATTLDDTVTEFRELIAAKNKVAEPAAALTG